MKNWEPFHKMCLDTWNRFHLKSRDVRWAMLYEGLLIQQVQCPKCRRCFHNPEPVSCLTLDIPEGAVSLADCFKEYFKPETLAEWRCDDCKIDTSAEKLVRFWKAPPVLTIVLKRFKPSADGRMRKNKTPIHIPLEFHFLEDTELYPREGEVKGAPKDYRLVAVANHYGDIHGGHYNATVRRGDAWWNIDDDHVSRIDPRAGGWWDANPRAYVLFYEK
jgi:ubiquitin C-terminal hydrolase